MTRTNDPSVGRRQFLSAAATLGTAGTGGCLEDISGAAEDVDVGLSGVDDGPTGAEDDPSDGVGGPSGGARGSSARERRWRFETAGWPGSPTVVDGTLYVGDVFGGGDRSSLYAVSTTDGTERWRRESGTDLYSPTVRGDVVYAGGGDGSVSAFSTMDGREQWRTDLYDATSITGLVVAGDALYAGSLGDTVYALDAADGSVRWRFQAERTIFERPAVAGGAVYAACDQGSYVHDDDEWGSVYALDAADGREQWRFRAERPIECPPTVVGAAGGTDGSSASSGDGTVYVDRWALSADDGTERWAAPIGEVRTRPTVVGGAVYVGSEDDNVYALDAADGSVLWRFETGFTVRSRPTVVGNPAGDDGSSDGSGGGTVYVGSGDGVLYVLDAADGSERWRFELAEDVYASPAVVGDTVYVACTDHHVYAIPTDGP